MSKLNFDTAIKETGEHQLAVFNLQGIFKELTVKDFVEKIKKTFSLGIEYYILHMEELVYIDSSGLNILVDLVDQGQQFGAKFFFVNLHPKIETICRALGLDTLVTLCKEEKTALEEISQKGKEAKEVSKLFVETKTRQKSLHFTGNDLELIDRVQSNIDTNRFELPVLPDMAIRLNHMVSSPKTTANDLEDLIVTDQSVATQVLKTANTMLYRGRFEVNSLKSAVIRLGMRKIRSTVFSIVMRATILKGEKIDIIARNLWKHSISCALLSEFFEKRISKKTRQEELFTSALLHDIHKVVILAICRDETKQLKHYFPSKEILEYINQKYFDLIFFKLAKKWKLPECVVETIPKLGNFNESKQKQMTAIISIANTVTKFFDKQQNSLVTILPEMNFFNITKDHMEQELLEEARELYEKIQKSW